MENSTTQSEVHTPSDIAAAFERIDQASQGANGHMWGTYRVQIEMQNLMRQQERFGKDFYDEGLVCADQR